MCLGVLNGVSNCSIPKSISFDVFHATAAAWNAEKLRFPERRKLNGDIEHQNLNGNSIKEGELRMEMKIPKYCKYHMLILKPEMMLFEEVRD